MGKMRIAVLIAAALAAVLFFVSPLPDFLGLLFYVGVFQNMFPATISWDAKNAFVKCYGAIDHPWQWPQGPHAACEAMWLCVNEAVLTPAEHDRLYSQIRATPGCQEP